MKGVWTLLLIVCVAYGCQKRNCGCVEDVNVTADAADMSLSLPNAVNENCGNFIIAIRSTTDLELSQQSVSFSKDEIYFLEGRDLSDFLERSSYLMADPIEFSMYEYIFYFPIEIFNIGGELIRQEMDYDITLVDAQGMRLEANGSSYFYRCNEIDSDFRAADCRWPSDIEWSQHAGLDCLCQ